jgi:hypothetical protein
VLAIPHLFGKDADAYWKSFDWGRAIRTGLAATGQPYSGHYGFLETEYFWPITHMVAPKEEALACGDCHAREGRMKDVPGFYMPGRDHSVWLDRIGWLMVLGTLAVVTLHGIGRILAARARRNKQ